MNNNVQKRVIKYKEYNDNGHTSKRLKTETNNQKNDNFISSSEIKELIKNSNMEKLKHIFDISKFFDNEFIQWLLLLYKNKTFISIMDLNKVISKDKYKFLLNYEKKDNSYNYIIENKNKNLLIFLVEHGVDLDKIVYENDEIALFDACRSGNKELVEYLLKNGTYINKENKNGITPLLYSCISGNKELVEYLLKNGADINKENKNGITPLLYACYSRNKELVEYLKKMTMVKHHYLMHVKVEIKI